MAPELYKSIEGFPLYEVSNYGRVRSWNNRFGKLEHPKQLKLNNNGMGRPVVSLSRNGKSTTKKVHHLILWGFCEPRPTEKHECCHNDGNRSNNHADNLRWGTHQENMADMVKHGTIKRELLTKRGK